MSFTSDTVRNRGSEYPAWAKSRAMSYRAAQSEYAKPETTLTQAEVADRV